MIGAPPISRKSVLVVDDEEGVRLAIRAACEDAGHHVTEAKNGKEAFQVLVHGWLPNIVFLDKNMPGFDGERFLKEIDQHGVFRELPVVIITGDELRNGTRVYLQKPITAEQVLDIVRLLAR